MDYLQSMVDFVLHFDVHMAELVALYGVWIYAILFVIIFCETGLVVTPFLPGDSLLFMAGALASLPTNHMNVNLLDILFVIKLDNKRCTSVCNALYTEAKVECEYLKALDDSMIPVW